MPKEISKEAKSKKTKTPVPSTPEAKTSHPLQRKEELLEMLSQKASVSKKEAGHFLNALLESLEETFLADKGQFLPRFGTFKLNDKPARMGRNPTNGEPLNIPAKKVLVFKPSSVIRDKVNQTHK